MTSNNNGKSERLKRYERRQRIKETGCVVIQNRPSSREQRRTRRICTVENEPQFVSYSKRKEQKKGKDDSIIKNDGIEYHYDKIGIRELFDSFEYNERRTTEYGHVKEKKSYIYIISKVIDGRTFFKIGYSNIGPNDVVGTRLESHKTSLIPGLQNIGFKLHYLFFYDKQLYGRDMTYAQSIEQELHKFLRNHDEFRFYTIHYPSEKPSEWYIPDEGKYHDFIQYILKFISVQIPEPVHAHHYFTDKVGRNIIDHREDKTEFFPKANDDEFLQYRRNFLDESNQIKITQQLSRSQQNLKKGSVQYFKSKLLNFGDIENTERGAPLGSGIKIMDVKFHNSTAIQNLQAREYYAIISSQDKNEEQMRQYINVSALTDVIETDGDDTNTENGSNPQYMVHMRDVLIKMNEIDTLDLYDLRSNYNFYMNKPIQIAKSKYFMDIKKMVSIPIKDVSWLKKHEFRDSSNKLFKVESIIALPSNNTKTNSVNITEIRSNIQGTTILRERMLKCNIFTALKLVVEYHEDKPPSLLYNHNYFDHIAEIQASDTKYKKYDMITIKKNYFLDDEGNPINEEYDAVISDIGVKKYQKDKDPAKCYDLLFQDGPEWTLEASSIDNTAHSKLKFTRNTASSRKTRKEFLENMKGAKGAIATNILQVLGENVRLTTNTRGTRIRQNERRQTRRQEPRTNRSPPTPQTRRQTRSSVVPPNTPATDRTVTNRKRSNGRNLRATRKINYSERQKNKD